MARDGVVYSSKRGRLCPACEQPIDGCTCDGTATDAPGGGPVHVRRETKGRKGRGVTVITGVPLAGADLKALAKRLKKLCGSGGSLKDGAIEIQGDHRDRVVPELEKRGWDVRRSGG